MGTDMLGHYVPESDEGMHRTLVKGYANGILVIPRIDSPAMLATQIEALRLNESFQRPSGVDELDRRIDAERDDAREELIASILGRRILVKQLLLSQ